MLVFLFTDIEGSTHLWEIHTTEMGAIIARHDEILYHEVARAGGQVTKHTGDGITAAFKGGDPVACAVRCQVAFAGEPWGAIGQLPIRAGLHAGPAELHSGDYFGPPVNCTARIMSAAWGGQILLTPAVTGLASLPKGASLRDLGQHLLKNVSQPQQIYQLLHPDLPRQTFPPPRSLSGQAIRQAVEEQGQKLAGSTPGGIAVSLVSATLLPTLAGDLAAGSSALTGNLGVLDDLGAGALGQLVAEFARHIQTQQQAGSPPTPAGVRQGLEQVLAHRWQAGDEAGLALRASTSLLLQTIEGVDIALEAATADIREALAQGLADLGGTFQEFRWVLDGLQETLIEMRTRQSLQLALQREQLDLQRQQLVKTNLLLQRPPTAAILPETRPVPLAEGSAEPSPAGGACPYKGLAAFEPEDTELFFGREELVAGLTARLTGTRFLAVIGPSGSGKSSLVRAGLLPAIWADALPGSRHWQTLILTPGPHPLQELAVRLSLMSQHAPASLLRELEADYRCLHLAVKAHLADQPAQVQLVLIVDQFEEIFALCRDEGERRQFVDALLCAVDVEGSRTIVVPTIRTDFYGRCAELSDLAAKLADSVLVGPLGKAELRQAVERPATMAGLRLEPGLAGTIVEDVAGEPGALPLLSHALLETWGRRRGRTLSLASYRESGGVAGAIAQTADSVFESFDAEQQVIARNIVLRLTELGELGTQYSRRRVAPSELVHHNEKAASVQEVLATLAEARLITLAEDTVEVAHEALIREWPALRGWLEEDQEGLRTHRHLTESALEWQRLEQDQGELYRGARLATAGEWAADHGNELNPLERAFLAASQELAHRREAQREAQRQRELEAERQRAEEQARNSRRLRWLVAGLALVLALAMVVAFFAWGQQQQAQQRESEAVAARATVEHQSSLITSRHLAAQSLNRLEESKLDLALLLAIEAFRAKDSAEARNSLLTALQASPHLAAHLPGHSGPVNSVALSPDGQILASGGDDLSIRLWDVAARAPLGQPLNGHTAPVTSIAFSPDGRFLASGSNDKTIRLWEVSTGTSLGQPLAGHKDWVTSVAFSPDGQTLASGSNDLTIRLWDRETGQPLGQPLAGHSDWVTSVAIRPNGETLASGSRDGTIRLWDVTGGQTLGQPLTGHSGSITSVAFDPKGQLLASGGQDGTIRLWAAASGESHAPPLEGHGGAVNSVTFGPEGQTLVSASHDGSLIRWDVASGQPLGEPLTGHSGWVHSVAFDPAGQLLVSGGEEGHILLWDVEAEHPLTRAGGRLNDPSTRAKAVAISPDSKILASGDAAGVIQLWDLASGELLGAPLTGHEHAVNGLAFSPDGGILASVSDDRTARLWDADSGEPLGTPLAGHEREVVSLAFAPDGKVLASGSADETVILWNVASGEPLGPPLTSHKLLVQALAFEPEGQVLASGGDGATIILWNVETREPLGQVSTGHVAGVRHLAFSTDGRTLASTGLPEGVVLWEVGQDHTIQRRLAIPAEQADSLSLSPDGTMVASNAGANAIGLWDVGTGQPIGLPLDSHVGRVVDLAFNSDGQTLASGSLDGTVKLWEVDPAWWIARACRIANRDFTTEEWTAALGEQDYRKTCGQLP